MKPILIDTNAYVAFKRGEPDAVALLENAPVVGVSAIVLGELLAGFAAGTTEETNREELNRFLAAPGVNVLPVQSRTAELYASIYVSLRKAATPIPTNDIWVAATAIEHQLDLFSYDQHFRSIEELRVITSPDEVEAAD